MPEYQAGHECAEGHHRIIESRHPTSEGSGSNVKMIYQSKPDARAKSFLGERKELSAPHQPEV